MAKNMITLARVSAKLVNFELELVQIMRLITSWLLLVVTRSGKKTESLAQVPWYNIHHYSQE